MEKIIVTLWITFGLYMIEAEILAEEAMLCADGYLPKEDIQILRPEIESV